MCAHEIRPQDAADQPDGEDEELEEEQRVQREQLAAIFQLLKENQETFGEVSERDVEDQLYSI
ncbi:unnamed protein product [Oncorhynchus mykiss]|uniref:Matrix-remodeling-associated protein 7 helical domain-containing protein n=1 Tax=Oncorhynchus mykiss TaxID=8022 RepID=A0A060XHF5_ONCMY|nr:unnamed protein product [Oncorhynchus mykiss]